MKKKEYVVIKITKEEASILWHQIDGWLDAGSCDDGLDEDEIETLAIVIGQIEDQTR